MTRLLVFIAGGGLVATAGSLNGQWLIGVAFIFAWVMLTVRDDNKHNSN